MWLDNLKELKKKSGMSSKQIAEVTNLPERTVIRIFSGDTPNPYADTLYRIVVILGGSLDDILADSKSVVGNQSLITLQNEVDKLVTQNETLIADNAMLAAENVMLKDKVVTISAENDILRMKLEHKEEIISLHTYYGSVIGGMNKGQPKKQNHE